MEIIRPETGTPLPLEFKAIKRLELPDVEVVELCLDEYQKIDLHRLTCKVIFYVKEGEGNFLNANDMKKVNKGTLIIVEPNEQRGWLCEQGQKIELLVVKIMK